MARWRPLIMTLALTFISQRARAQTLIQEAEAQAALSSGVTQVAYAHASAGSVLQGQGAIGWRVGLKPGLSGQYLINVRTRAGYARGDAYGIYSLIVNGHSLALARDDSTKVWHSDDENYVWWKMVDLDGAALTPETIAQVSADWGWGFIDAYEITPVACEAEALPPQISAGVVTRAYPNAQGGNVLQSYGEDGWHVGLAPGLTGRYTINIRTRAGYMAPQPFGAYHLSIAGQDRALTRDDSTAIWYSGDENYVWWRMVDPAGVSLTANSTGQITGDWRWGFVDAYEYIPVLVREAEDTSDCTSGGAFQTRDKAHASAGRVFQQAYNANLWPHYITPRLSGWFQVEFRTRHGDGTVRLGDYSLQRDGVYLSAFYDPATVERYDGEDNYIWWKTDVPVRLSDADRLDITSSWAWGMVDAYRFTPSWHRYIEAEDPTYCSSPGVWQTRAYANASGGVVYQQSYSGDLWPHRVAPRLSGKYVIRVRTRFGYLASQDRPYGAVSIALDGQALPLNYERETRLYIDDNENYVWWSTIVPVALTPASVLETRSQWGWDMIDAYDFIRVP